MVKELIVGELRKALEGVPDDLPVKLSSDTGVDLGEGIIKIESARRINYNIPNGRAVDYFEIYANDTAYEDDEDEHEED